MGEIKFVASIIFLIMFTIAVVGYALTFANDNEVYIDLANDSEFSALSTTLNTNIKTFSTQVNSSSGIFSSSTIASGDETTVTGGQFKIGVRTLIQGIKAIGTVIRTKIFGGSTAFAIFLSALVGFLVYSGFRYIWKTWKGGNPD